MGRLFGRLLGIIGIPGDVETIGKLVATMLTIAGGTGVWAYVVEGLPWAVFIAFGIFFFGVSAFVVLTNAYAVRRLPNKIYVGVMRAHQWRQPEAGAQVGIQLLVGLNSMASFEIFFEVESTEFSIGGKPGMPDKTRKVQGVIAPHNWATIALATVVTNHNFENGRLTMQVKYGREKGDYTHRMEITLEFFPVAHLPADQQGILEIMRNNISMDYQRLPNA